MLVNLKLEHVLVAAPVAWPDVNLTDAHAVELVDAVDSRFRGTNGRNERGKQTLPRLGLMTARADRASGKAAHVVWTPHGFASRRADMSRRRSISLRILKLSSTANVDPP